MTHPLAVDTVPPLAAARRGAVVPIRGPHRRARGNTLLRSHARGGEFVSNPRSTSPPAVSTDPGADPQPPMPNPKRRHSKSRTGLRRSHLALKDLQLNRCAHCGAAAKPHRVCDNCGYYAFSRGGEKKGTDVLEKQDF